MRSYPDLSEPLNRKPAADDLDALLAEVRACRLCAAHLPHEPRPVLTLRPGVKILIIGQAPGSKVHATGLPWNDASGDRLRAWMGIGRQAFYEDPAIGVMPMGFCYPGKGLSGDLPPRRECAPSWHAPLWRQMPDLSLVLLVGAYAQRHYLKGQRSLTETMRAWQSIPKPFFPLPHPSPRNIAWFLKNPWFEDEVLPELRTRMAPLLPEASR